MHIAVLGAGVVGVTTAWYLTKTGHEVTIVDRAGEVAAGASHANGGQLSYSYTDAWANPSFALRIPGLLLGGDPAIRISPGFDAGFVRWGARFLLECRSARARANTLQTLQLALRSGTLLEELRQELGGDFAFRKAGKLVMLASDRDIDSARRGCALKAEHGCETRVISVDEAIEIEPAIARMRGGYKAAQYSPNDEFGDALAFTGLLADTLVGSGRCRLLLGTEILDLRRGDSGIVAARTDRGEIDADAYVVCLGVGSQSLLRPLGINPGICPVRGYSVTLPLADGTPGVSVTDLARRFVVSRMKNSVRIAGFADFVGLDDNADQRRVGDLMRVAATAMPFAADYLADDKSPWGGLRPITVSGQPMIGSTPIERLYVNTGHGSLGWTLACASAEALTGVVNTTLNTNKDRKAAENDAASASIASG